MLNYSFVLDIDGKPLAPTKKVKAWYMIRKGKAILFELQSPTKHCKKVNAKKCKLLWKYSKIYWLDNVT